MRKKRKDVNSRFLFPTKVAADAGLIGGRRVSMARCDIVSRCRGSRLVAGRERTAGGSMVGRRATRRLASVGRRRYSGYHARIGVNEGPVGCHDSGRGGVSGEVHRVGGRGDRREWCERLETGNFNSDCSVINVVRERT